MQCCLLPLLLLLLGLGALAPATGTPAPGDRAERLVQQMTLDEKLTMLTGVLGDYIGNTPAIPRLKIPALKLHDGPQGFRDDARPGTSTAFPSNLHVGASWSPELSLLYGRAMGREFAAKGANVQLGPGMNLARVPQNGRNFEYIAGEDPWLGRGMVGPVVRGIQSAGVIANAKHFLNNEQELNRGAMSAWVDERTQFEVYLPPFQAAVEAQVGSLMCSYNKINSTYACENLVVLETWLRGHLNFSDGWVMSDWGATHSPSIVEGLDQEMPGGLWFTDGILGEAVRGGIVPEGFVDRAVLRILRPMFRMGLFDREDRNTIAANVTSPAHNQVARQLASAGMVLLKNSPAAPGSSTPLLPLDPSRPLRIAVVGLLGAHPIFGGLGSGSVFPPYLSSPYMAFRERLGLRVPGVPRPDCSPELWETDVDYEQPFTNPASPARDPTECCQLCQRRPDCTFWTFQSSLGLCWFKRHTGGRKASPGMISGACYAPEPDLPVCSERTGHCVYVSPTDDPLSAVVAAANADTVVVAVGINSGEAFDRPTLGLDAAANQLIEAVVGLGKPVVALVTAPGAVLLPFADKVQGILLNFLAGQEVGHAAVDLLFGDSNPSGRLPITIPFKDNEMRFTEAQYPGLNGGIDVHYTEKLEVGYRWYDAHGVQPHYSFGFGLSYTSFQYGQLQVQPRGADQVVVSFVLTNTGARPGVETPQVYIGFPREAGQPPKVLRGWAKTELKPGERQLVSIPLVSSRDLSIWDVSAGGWRVIPGNYEVLLGASAADIRLRQSFRLP